MIGKKKNHPKNEKARVVCPVASQPVSLLFPLARILKARDSSPWGLGTMFLTIFQIY